ncbi:MAG: disulfide bond formation protein B [Rhodothermaceae bacterium]|nr:disulfide bond formation protein B [Rhodothermaceae bacterium]
MDMGALKTENNADANWTILFVCWLIASISTLGSLFFSEILDFPPCMLCWYQRICLFPLVVILLAGLFPFDKTVVKFAFPLNGIGWLISVYHNLLYLGVIPESIQPCDETLSCTEVHLGLFGFITIPMLSFMAFTVMGVLLLLLHRRSSQ